MNGPDMRSRWLRGSALSVLITGLVLGTAAGWASAATKTTSTTAPPRPAFSSASGTVAAISGDSMEVQNPTSGQVTVSWTSSTTFTQTVSVPASQLAVGDCVTVESSSTAKTGPIKATTVSVRTATNGSCEGGFGFGGAAGGAAGGTGGAGAFNGGSFPRGTFGGGSFPRGSAGSGHFTAGRFATGEVTSVSGSTFVVKGFAPLTSTSTKKKSKNAKPASTVRKVTDTKVTFGSTTTFTTTEAASATNLGVGLCATALGPAGQTGAITASTISIRQPGANGCTTSFAGFGAFAGRPPA